MRKEQRAFLAEAAARSRETERTGKYVDGEEVFGQLESILARAVQAQAGQRSVSVST